MDIHTRIVAVLHIVCGLIGAAGLLLLALMLGGFAAFLSLPEIPAFLLGLGVSLVIVFMVLALAETVAGFALLMGSPVGRILTMVFGVLHLVNIPIGTVLGAYTLWALLRKQPGTSGIVA